MSNLIKFTKGQELSAKFIGDQNAILKAKVLSRTAKFVTVKVENYSEPKRCKVTEYEGVETIQPLGNYSMSPVMKAL